MKIGIYKPGQGKYARVIFGGLSALMLAYGSSALAGTLRDLGSFKLGNQVFPYGQIIPGLVFIVCAAALFVLLNYPKFADFLIETEIEMGRVVWPTRRSVIASSVVVVVTMLLLSVILYGLDSLLYQLLRLVKIY